MQREKLMKTKKVLFKLISCAALLSMVACAGNKQSSSPQGDSTTPSSDTEPSSSEIEYGAVTIQDIEVTFMNEVIINPVFEKEEYEEALTYTFEGNNISITEGKVKGLVPGTETIVTAASEHFRTTFKVTVNYNNAVLTDTTGAESKYSVPVPDASRYLLHFDVDCETVIDAGMKSSMPFS